MRKSLVNSYGYQTILNWMNEKDFTPFSYQEKTWNLYDQQHSGLVVAPTGFGKTYSIFLATVIHFLNHPKRYKKGLKLLWISPLRSLSNDIAKAMQDALDEIGLDWVVGVRTGDVSSKEKQKQFRNMPEILVITPESLHLLMAQKKNKGVLKNLHCVVVDEWHELLGTKRGVLVELALTYLNSLTDHLKIWALTATIGNIEEALDVLCPFKPKRKIVRAKEKKKILIESVLPDELEILPWAGHMGSSMTDKVVDIILENKTTLVFTNTRNQSENWYQNILTACPDLAGLIAIHHGSIDLKLRHWIEENLAEGNLKAVVCTSSLDLGVDFKPVDTVVQIGSSKGIARFLQRAGRSGHSPDEISKIYFVPTHTLEIVEVAALKEGYKQMAIERRQPHVLTFDVLVQFMVTLALGEGFYEEELFQLVKATHAFNAMIIEEWRWSIRMITQGGDTLSEYEEYHKVIKKEVSHGGGKKWLYKVESRRVGMLHRMNIGVIVSDAMMRVKFMSGGYIGMVEEYFISKLKPGDHFVLGGRVVSLVSIKERDILVRASQSKKAFAPSWLGGRLPMTSYLSKFLREKIAMGTHPKRGEKELKFLKPLFEYLNDYSQVPAENDFLVEYTENRYGFHLFFYPFEGRLIHEIMASIIAYRFGQLSPISFSIATNDYGFELATDQPISVSDEILKTVLSKENLSQDIVSSINATEMAKRKFRDIACIAGFVYQNVRGRFVKFKSIQSSSNLIFNVLNENDPNNLLVRQAYDEVFNHQLEEARLMKAFDRISKSNIIFKRTERFTPLSFPLKIENVRQRLSSEDLATRIRKMKEVKGKNFRRART